MVTLLNVIWIGGRVGSSSASGVLLLLLDLGLDEEELLETSLRSAFDNSLAADEGLFVRLLDFDVFEEDFFLLLLWYLESMSDEAVDDTSEVELPLRNFSRLDLLEVGLLGDGDSLGDLLFLLRRKSESRFRWSRSSSRLLQSKDSIEFDRFFKLLLLLEKPLQLDLSGLKHITDSSEAALFLRDGSSQTGVDKRSIAGMRKS